MKVSHDPSEDSAEMVVARGKRNSRANAFLEIVIGSFFSLMGIATILASSINILSIALSAAMSVLAYHGAKNWVECRRGAPLPVWLSIEKEQQKTLLPFQPARSFGESIRKIYQTNPQKETLSLIQAVQLFHVYIGQHKQLKVIEARLEDVEKLHQEVTEKLEQLQNLGEEHPQSSAHLKRINRMREELESDKNRVQNSCHRMQEIVDSAQNAAQVGKLRAELDQLSAAATPTEDSTFAPESLEEIERQIGCEIETYLQLERETDEHLR